MKSRISMFLCCATGLVVCGRMEAHVNCLPFSLCCLGITFDGINESEADENPSGYTLLFGGAQSPAAVNRASLGI